MAAITLITGFNTQPPEGGWQFFMTSKSVTGVSTHSRPKAAGLSVQTQKPAFAFQHTAARRRLAAFIDTLSFTFHVSTHSRPKAAGFAATCPF